MTPTEWLECERPGPMLAYLRGRASDRQLRHFACACCRSVLGFVPTGPCRDALEMAERFAEGRATREELAAARAKSVAVATNAGTHSAAAWAACESANPSAMRSAMAVSDEAQEQIRRQSPAAADDEARVQAGFLRDIFGNPFQVIRPSALRQAATNRRIREVAQEIQSASRQEDWMILAGELERLGCPPTVVDHCRGEEPHVRGCWVIELLLHESPASEATESRDSTALDEPLASIKQVRRAMEDFLGPKKYRRFLRKCVADSPRPGRLAQQEEWARFLFHHPIYAISDEQYDEAFAICGIHHSKLIERTIKGYVHEVLVGADPAFLQARGTEFPHSFSEPSGGEWERRIWWCPDCQFAREHWNARRE